MMQNTQTNIAAQKIQRFFVGLFLLIFSFVLMAAIFPDISFAQAKPLIKRTTYRNEKIDFGAGGTLTIVGAPTGSITIEGWQNNQVEVTADIEVQAENEQDLALLAKVNGFVLDQDFGHIRIGTVGTYDKLYMKKVAKKFPKNLLDKPFKIDYHIKVPVYCDLEINGGRGDLKIAGVEGVMQIKVLEGNGDLTLTGGTVIAVFGGGNVDVSVASRSWRGRQVDFQVANGTLNFKFLPNTNAEINAEILRSGKIENSIESLKPRPSGAKFTDKNMSARAGNGGAVFNLTVGDGTLRLKN